MSDSPLSKEVALRIGLAAREFDGLDARALLEILIGMFGLPLTEDKLSRVTVTGLKGALAGDIDQDAPQADYGATSASRKLPSLESLKNAVRYLWGFQTEEDASPFTSSDTEIETSGSLRVAVATSDGDRVDEHFGVCRRFFIYHVSINDARLLGCRSTADSVDAEDASAFRAELLKDCHVIYVQSIGGPAAAKVIQRGACPLKVEDRAPVDEVLKRLQEKMANNPPPWLAKAMNIPVEDRIRFQQAVEP